MLIDAGNHTSPNVLLNDIKSMGITRFDLFMATTHPNEDYIVGLGAPIIKFSIGQLSMPTIITIAKTFIDVLTAIKNKGYAVSAPVPRLYL